MVLVWILVATALNSFLALIGGISLLIKKAHFEKLIFVMISFSAGALLSGAFLHLIPEALESIEKDLLFIIVFVGFCSFFLIERFLHWHHCHEGHCKVHPISWLITIGDTIHNFVDGTIITASFLVSIPFGFLTTALIIAHELPQELGDFAILVHSGVKKRRALLMNFISQTACIFGALLSYFLLISNDLTVFLLPFAAGGFIYISASDLIPELHREASLKKSLASFIIFIAGVLFIFSLKLLFG
ncbi:MAG: ZIP family metal transporter [Candidatus Diapherotrites archaeon]|nr:ZIP family metal transporter [Candidatus Diapherotrites archaeon]